MSSEDAVRPARWLLLFNCQATGLANCLETLSPGLEVERYDALSFKDQVDEIRPRFGDFDQIVIAPRVKSVVGEEVSTSDRILWMPHVWFQGYHPDICYLGASGPIARGAIGPYHSVIAFAAYALGLSVEQTLRLFREDVYSALGYFDAWGAAREGMLRDFDEHGYDLRPLLPAWVRQGPFMHSVNHPKIRVLMDLARMLLRKAGRPVHESDIVPQDNLVQGPVFPVYPEVASRLGAVGSYVFKRGATYRTKTLAEFVGESFEIYRSLGDFEPSNPGFVPAIERAKALIRELHPS